MTDSVAHWEDLKVASVGQPCCRVTMSADQTVASSSTTDIAFDTEQYDVRDEFDTGTYTFTAKDAGYYLITASVNILSSDVVADKYLQVQITDSAGAYYDIAMVHTVGALGVSGNPSTVAYLDAGGTVKIRLRHVMGANADVDASYSFLSITKIASIGMTGSPRCVAYLSAKQLNIADSTVTQVQLDSEEYDLFGEFDTGAYNFTASAEGYYLIVARILWETVVTDKEHYVYIYVNGVSTRVSKVISNTTANQGQEVVGIVHLDAGDVVDMRCQQKSGGATTDVFTDNTAVYTALEIAKLDCTGSGGFNSRAHGYLSGVQSINTATETTVALDTELFDGMAEFDVATGLFTPKESGYYSLSAAVRFEAMADQSLAYVRIRVGGTTVAYATDTTSGNNRISLTMSVVAYVKVGQDVDLRAYQASGGAIVLTADAACTFLSAHRLS